MAIDVYTVQVPPRTQAHNKLTRVTPLLRITFENLVTQELVEDFLTFLEIGGLLPFQ